MQTIRIPVRELHARTGHYVRKAAAKVEVVVTERGVPTARLVTLDGPPGGPARLTIGERRKLLPEYSRLFSRGAFRTGGGLKESDRALRDL
jgi:prevent-host-death family protein